MSFLDMDVTALLDDPEIRAIIAGAGASAPVPAPQPPPKPARTNKLVVGFPLYRSLPVRWFTNWLLMDKTAVAGFTSIDGAYLPIAMERIRDSALKEYPDFDRLVIMEHDVLPPVEAFARIANYPLDDGYDIVGSMYFGREHPFQVQGWMRAPDGPGYLPARPEAVKEMMATPAAYPVDAVGFGFTSISRRVFDNWNDDGMFTPPADLPPQLSHDFSFCERARRQGFKIWIDSGIICGHLGEHLVTIDDNQAAPPVPDTYWQEQ